MTQETMSRETVPFSRNLSKAVRLRRTYTHFVFDRYTHAHYIRLLPLMVTYQGRPYHIDHRHTNFDIDSSRRSVIQIFLVELP